MATRGSSLPDPMGQHHHHHPRGRAGGLLARTWGAVAIALAATHWNVPLGVEAYIPALPVNDTSALNSSNDILHLYSYNGVFK